MAESLNFLEEIIETDLESGKHDGRVLTRFPPEPNGYLHIGHAKSICLNFGLAKKYGGQTNLRFDDTNPVTEDTEYVDSIQNDIRWLGFEWSNLYYASDYFEQLHDFAVQLIKGGYAYVDFSSAAEIAAMKGTPTEAGTNSPYRDTSPEENIALFVRMRAGEFDEGQCTLRAKVDMSAPNMHLRDPLMYRIKKASHHRTGDKWCIYPMYDFAHGQSDAIERITHSICTLEFIPHRDLYDWFIEKLNIFPSHQYEFARLNLTYTVMSKRKLLQLVNEKLVAGWDDPRMPTICGMRRRGYTPASLRNFCDRIGIARRENVIEVALLEFCVREDLNANAHRVMAVLNPLKVTIKNYPEGQTELMLTDNNPEDTNAGMREVPFTRNVFIEREDFMETPPKKYFRMTPGGLVRLKGAYIVRCDSVINDAEGNPIEVLCSYIPESKSGNDTSGINVKGTLHWVSADHCIEAEARMYDRLFSVIAPDSDKDRNFKEFINPDSLRILPRILVEPALATAQPGDRFQFLRNGYFCVDTDSKTGKLIFNRTVGLKDTWAKETAKA